MPQIDIAIIGAGVVGLAVGRNLAKSFNNKAIFIIEKNRSFGQETSSRNSEVIHAGIYYPTNSLKAKTCVHGKRLLYEFCRKYNIPHRKTGKLIVAINDDELPNLESLLKKGLENEVDDLSIMDKRQIKLIEPNIKTNAAIYSPSTGIIDSHSFMKKLLQDFRSSPSNDIAYSTTVVGIAKTCGGFKIYVKDANGESFNFTAKTLINCAGLNSDKIAEMAGITQTNYKLKYCKGDYFRVHNYKARFINRLIYPVPLKRTAAGLGIHATLDLAQNLRLGPDDEYINEIDWTIDPQKQTFFYESVKSFLPFIEQEDLAADTCGIRPKLQGRGEEFRDFIIRDEADKNLPGLINLIGIESPGLTAALSIAKIVNELAIKQQ